MMRERVPDRQRFGEGRIIAGAASIPTAVLRARGQRAIKISACSFRALGCRERPALSAAPRSRAESDWTGRESGLESARVSQMSRFFAGGRVEAFERGATIDGALATVMATRRRTEELLALAWVPH